MEFVPKSESSAIPETDIFKRAREYTQLKQLKGRAII